MTSEQPNIEIDKVAFSWDLERGLMLCWDQPVVCWWIETTMAGFMAGIQRMVGTERFNLALEGAGRESTAGEWDHIILAAPTVEEGLAYIGHASRVVGLGEWELLELDRAGQRMRFRARNSWEGMYQRAMGVTWGTWSLAGKLASYSERTLGVPCSIEQTSFIAQGDEYDEFTVTASATTFEQRLETVVDSDHATRQDLANALARVREEVRERQAVEARLRDEIAERERIEADLRAKISVIHQQEQTLLAVSTPILQIWPGIVTLPIIGAIDGGRAALIMEALLTRITAVRARLVIIDLTGADTLDVDAADSLIRLVHATRLLGAESVMSGISPLMAATLVSTDARLHSVRAYGTLEAALQDALKSMPGRK